MFNNFMTCSQTFSEVDEVGHGSCEHVDEVREHVTNFSEHVTNFLEHVTNFLEHVTNFLEHVANFCGAAEEKVADTKLFR